MIITSDMKRAFNEVLTKITIMVSMENFVPILCPNEIIDEL